MFTSYDLIYNFLEPGNKQMLFAHFIILLVITNSMYFPNQERSCYVLFFSNEENNVIRNIDNNSNV